MAFFSRFFGREPTQERAVNKLQSGDYNGAVRICDALLGMSSISAEDRCIVLQLRGIAKDRSPGVVGAADNKGAWADLLKVMTCPDSSAELRKQAHQNFLVLTEKHLRVIKKSIDDARDDKMRANGVLLHGANLRMMGHHLEACGAFSEVLDSPESSNSTKEAAQKGINIIMSFLTRVIKSADAPSAAKIDALWHRGFVRGLSGDYSDFKRLLALPNAPREYRPYAEKILVDKWQATDMANYCQLFENRRSTVDPLNHYLVEFKPESENFAPTCLVFGLFK